MYNVKDNAEAKLQVWLSSLATTLVVELGNGMLFPEAPFIAVLNKRDSDWKIVKSEKVEVTDKDGDQFTVNRWFESTTPQDFNAWDFFSLFVLARHIQDLQWGIENNASNIWALWVRMTSAEDAISELEKAWAINHLEGKVMIGEKITSSDEIFLQYTPKALDSIIWIPVWSTANNTQIHIQRSSSWKAWSTIKMKIRSVWEPTTKVVLEVQKASVVDATTEYYRYWNWTTIATAELPYSTFTNEWQEVTFTFDNEFWEWDERELLSVVVHQNDNIVNASNYYEIACDWNQYSEAFRFIYCDSNQSVISYEKLMPYCEWDWLASMMLCRCDSSTYTINQEYPLLTNFNEYCSNPSYPLYKVIQTKYSRNIRVKWNVYWNRSSSYSNRNWYITIYDWGNATVFRTQSGSNGNFDEAIEENYTLSNNTANLILHAGSTYSWRSGWYTNFSVYWTGCRITKTQNWLLVKAIIDDTLSVWDTVQATTVWMFWDSYFEWWIYCVDDIYDITATWSISWFIAPTNWLLISELTANDNLNYRVEVNRVPVIRGTKWTSWQALHIKKWDEVLCLSSSSATFYWWK